MKLFTLNVVFIYQRVILALYCRLSRYFPICLSFCLIICLPNCLFVCSRICQILRSLGQFVLVVFGSGKCSAAVFCVSDVHLPCPCMVLILDGNS